LAVFKAYKFVLFHVCSKVNGQILIKVTGIVFPAHSLIEKIYISVLVLDGGEWLNSRSGCFTPVKELRYPLNRRLVGPQSQFGLLGGEKFSCES